MLKVDPRSSTPIYEQIELGIKELILKGALQGGDKIPSVREMAGILTINPNTISKAYGELERDGIIETLRGKGTFVVDNFKSKVDENKMQHISEELKKIILEASYNGMNKDSFVELALKIFSELGVDNK
ncbi:GntR family transcriptional regulator [Clostridium saccharobutylicum]|uniref:HTH-type transcriptional repressor YtrA n=1 Tax=Clostridium saccharobutylicum DSM 13864 TaxID=1345695 RepID=U5MUS5_CLOSA|nr:GntR family transcriptional regulator [Clostridium saccharobutylicum]AGX44350.1 HTH-type transcriptional repressor YtrA [Clostridium saccharobutylicum DSM 13864]MBA2906936.1 GntR family transcriptional regulator [Clostridium saccharobutylicum]MBA8791530.1 GntR family transcriptional regulator [Clostridium saccharobutylicum]MBA8898213.1 GntR family transcriptional regulator [Clostridium saccharobutylicum]MBA8995758.1 GntR family transcriptional regulator [Clostridium saccharobutylicum]